MGKSRVANKCPKITHQIRNFTIIGSQNRYFLITPTMFSVFSISTLLSYPSFVYLGASSAMPNLHPCRNASPRAQKCQAPYFCLRCVGRCGWRRVWGGPAVDQGQAPPPPRWVTRGGAGVKRVTVGKPKFAKKAARAPPQTEPNQIPRATPQILYFLWKSI